MTGRLITTAIAALASVMLLGLGTSAFADSADFALFDNTNPATAHEGVQCTASGPFTYHISVSNFGSGPNVLRLTYADCDFTRFKIPQDESLNLSGAARGRDPRNADFSITACGESTQLAGQMSALSNGNAKCKNVTCGAGGVAPGC